MFPLTMVTEKTRFGTGVVSQILILIFLVEQTEFRTVPFLTDEEMEEHIL